MATCPVLWRTVCKGGHPKTDHVGTTRTPGWHPEETEALTANKRVTLEPAWTAAYETEREPKDPTVQRDGTREPWRRGAICCCGLSRQPPFRRTHPIRRCGIVLSYLIRYGWTVAHVSILVARLGPIIRIFNLTSSLSFPPRLFLCPRSFRRCGATGAVCCGSG